MPASSSAKPKRAERPTRRVTKRRILLAGFTLLLISVIAVVWFSGEPAVDGKPISHWISKLGTSDSQAAAVLDKLDAEKTIPHLLRVIAGKDLEGSARQRFYRRHYNKIPAFLRNRLPAPQPAPSRGTMEYIQTRAGYYLIQLGNKHPSSAAMIVPQLVPLLESTNRIARFSAGIALSGFGTNAALSIPVVEKLLRNDPEKVHDIMLSVLEKSGPNGKTAIPTLKHCLDSTNGHLAIPCARTLWAMDSSYADLVRPVATKFSTTEDAGIRIESASLLWRIDTNPAPVVPVLIGLLNEDDHPFDYRAFLLLKRIGPGASNAIPALTERLNRTKRKEEFFLKAATNALVAIGGTPPANSTNIQYAPALIP